MESKNKNLPAKTKVVLPLLQKEVVGMQKRLKTGGLKKMTGKEIMFLGFLSLNQNIRESKNEILKGFWSLRNALWALAISLIVLSFTILAVIALRFFKVI